MRGCKCVCEYLWVCERDERFFMWKYSKMGINYNTLNRNGVVTFGSASELLRRDRISAISSRQTTQQPGCVHPRKSNKTISFFHLHLNTFRFQLFALHFGYVRSSVLRVGWSNRNDATTRWFFTTCAKCKCGRAHSLSHFIAYNSLYRRIYCVLMWQFHFVTDTNG